jgi:hypothetical protein
LALSEHSGLSDLYRLLLGVLCVWRITHLFQAEDGPWDVIVRLRRVAGDSFVGRLMDCFYCLMRIPGQGERHSGMKPNSVPG